MLASTMLQCPAGVLTDLVAVQFGKMMVRLFRRVLPLHAVCCKMLSVNIWENSDGTPKLPSF